MKLGERLGIYRVELRANQNAAFCRQEIHASQRLD